MIDRDGTIYQLVPRSIMCRHTVGLNYTSFGIEHVGKSDGDVMNNKRQLAASLRLTRWLRCRYGIATKNVIGHSESLSSPYHKENVERMRNQTHGDMTKATMRKYRSQLGAVCEYRSPYETPRGGCPADPRVGGSGRSGEAPAPEGLRVLHAARRLRARRCGAHGRRARA